MLHLLRSTIIGILAVGLAVSGLATPAYAGVNKIMEEDGSPAVYPWVIKFPNGSVTDNGDSTVSVSTSGTAVSAATLVVASSTTTMTGDYTCDGTNDHVEIQAAIDSLGAAGGRVLLSEGTFGLGTTLTLNMDASQYICLQGQGKGTKLQTGGGSNIDTITVSGANGQMWEIKDLVIDGARSSVTAGSGIKISIDSTNDTRAIIENVWIAQCDEHGIEMTNTDIRAIQFKNVFISGVDETCFLLYGSDHYVTNCTADSGVIGFQCNAGNSLYTANKAYYCETGFDVDVARQQFTGNQAQDNTKDGFYLNAANLTLTGNYADSNNRDGSEAGTFAGINMSADADDCTVVGNTCHDRGGTNYQDYGIIVAAGVTGSRIGYNTLEDNLTGEISCGADEYTNNIIYSNVHPETEPFKVPFGTAPTTPVAPGEMALDTNLIAQGMLEIYMASALGYAVVTTDTPGDNEVPTYDSGGGTVQWEPGGAGGGGTYEIGFMPQGAKLTGSDITNSAAIDAGDRGWRILLDDTTQEEFVYQFVVGPNYAAGTATLEILFSMTSVQSGDLDVKFDAKFMAVTHGDAIDWNTDGYDSEQTTTVDLATDQPAGYVRKATITFTQTQADEMAVDDIVRLHFERDPTVANDAAGDVEILGLLLHE